MAFECRRHAQNQNMSRSTKLQFYLFHSWAIVSVRAIHNNERFSSCVCASVYICVVDHCFQVNAMYALNRTTDSNRHTIQFIANVWFKVQCTWSLRFVIVVVASTAAAVAATAVDFECLHFVLFRAPCMCAHASLSVFVLWPYTDRTAYRWTRVCAECVLRVQSATNDAIMPVHETWFFVIFFPFLYGVRARRLSRWVIAYDSRCRWLFRCARLIHSLSPPDVRSVVRMPSLIGRVWVSGWRLRLCTRYSRRSGSSSRMSLCMDGGAHVCVCASRASHCVSVHVFVSVSCTIFFQFISFHRLVVFVFFLRSLRFHHVASILSCICSRQQAHTSIYNTQSIMYLYIFLYILFCAVCPHITASLVPFGLVKHSDVHSVVCWSKHSK